jgi:hypothetical protein
MTAPIKAANWALAIAGAIAGGAAGFFVFLWLYNQGWYAAMLPGAALGAAGGALLKGRSIAFGVACALFALLLGVFSHWWIRIPDENEGAGYFYLLMHPGHMSSVPLILIALGGVFGYWFGQGRESSESAPGK